MTGEGAASRLVRRRAAVSGVVQGVGFRPFVYNLALALGLTGFVTNTALGVELAVQGTRGAVEEFFRRLLDEAPPLARILEVDNREEEPQPGQTGFAIQASREGVRRTLISPDVAVCEACLAEMQDPGDRRFGYPFINCTHCGPRYTIIRDLPYDRPKTTMQPFVMCPDCLAEYHDPTNRRFHAQPNACPVCGPRLWLADGRGNELPGPDPVGEAARLLKEGRILAIKGLGGFHLAVDALNQGAVEELRRRKGREEKPLAVMVPDLAAARELADLDPESETALFSRERPIVLVPRREDAPLAPGVAPNNRLVGLMLPYTPLHHLLMDRGFKALVMTSGNLSEEPICRENPEAVERLGAGCPGGGIADFLLLHDRGIFQRADDSVVRVVEGRVRYLRRSRGFAPAPLILDKAVTPRNAPVVLAVGAQLKNTLCFLRGREAFLSQHLGDLDDLSTLEFFEKTEAHLEKVLESKPEILACDLHPDYLSTRWARERGLPLVRVQHHHAHALAVMAEHGLAAPVLALSLDGTGYGPDGTVWGGELLEARLDGYTRLGRLKPFSLIGGDRAVREPWRTGLAVLLETLGLEETARLDLPLVQNRAADLPVLHRMAVKGLNSPRTSSLGRLFDAVAAIMGLRERVAYEGQAAVELEQAMHPESGEPPYPMGLLEEEGLLVLDWRPAVDAMLKDLAEGLPPERLSARFHAGITAGLAAWALEGSRRTGLDRVVLGGGCLMNAWLLTRLPRLLEKRGLLVHTPCLVPAGDGGLALGQALGGAWMAK